jgi:hypothetical protein
MLDGHRCERCGQVILGPRAEWKQTKYCDSCAKIQKRENTLDPWTLEERRAYMRIYMRQYRRLRNSPITYDAGNRGPSLRCFAIPPAIVLLSVLPLLIRLHLTDLDMGPDLEALGRAVEWLEIVAIKVTGLAVLVRICWRHLASMRHETGGEE